ncbi:MAG: polysaccharide biosynthesis protein [Proteobacteria bacterium]|nr:polysaccharide biosynthesis protein [Pseudomonadota bacterium]
MDRIKIRERLVGREQPPYIIAEIGANHNGDMALCRKMIDAAHKCGADAVKFQSWAQDLVSVGEYERNTEYSDKKRHFGSLREMVDKYQFTEDQHREIAVYCAKTEIDFLSSCFSKRDVELLDEVGVNVHKLASMDIDNFELLGHVATTGKPVMLSTGLASMSEIAAAVEFLEERGSGPVVLFHCISLYPPKMEDVHLRNIPMLREAFELPVGFSDHTMGTAIPLAAIALGACVIEKHFTLDRDMDGWDHWISATPEELTEIVEHGRDVFHALGHSRRTVSPAELEKRKSFRRSLVVLEAKRAGDRLQFSDLAAKRPGTGIPPKELERIVGRRLARDVEAEQLLSYEDLE